MKSSVEFKWNSEEFSALLQSCPTDDSVNLSIKNLPDKAARILEAGCGSGRVVKYLFDLGYKDVHGIELNAEAVNHINQQFQELKIIQGDILNMPYQKASFDAVLSYGVVEHFPESVVKPLESLYNVLKPGGVAIITVPSLNRMRATVARLKLEYLHPKTMVRIIKRWLRQLKTEKTLRTEKAYLYYHYPVGGDFFEYRLTPQEFEDVCRAAGFEVVESIPISHIDGLHHSFGSLLVGFSNWKFSVGFAGRIINRFLLRFRFFHNHMHACVLKRPN